MKIFSLKILPLLLSSFLAAVLICGNAIAKQVGIKIMQKEQMGNYLVAGNGMTLYTFSKDEKNKSNCIEGCAVNWPPFYADPAAVIEGCEAGDFTTITREDGRQQTTYRNRPLYYFINDKYPGDTFGHGIGNVWFIVKPEE